MKCDLLIKEGRRGNSKRPTSALMDDTLEVRMHVAGKGDIVDQLVSWLNRCWEIIFPLLSRWE